jgi:hypothetical protein
MRLLQFSQRSLDEAAEAARVGFWARDRPLTGSQFDTLSVRSWPVSDRRFEANPQRVAS